MSKAQISFEYLFILGFAFILIIGSITIFTMYTRTTNPQVSGGQAHKIASDLLASAKEVYGIGKDAWITLDVNIPDEIEDIRILNYEELQVTYNTPEGTSSIVLFSDIPLWTGSGGEDESISPDFHSGRMLIRVRSHGTNVSITERTT
ncbi:hypothetical protein D6783_00125 [Candidatus Woesearchaeota archaeon]|nr:MAG: hypothetical protein D6783_00125 [Candidatus Woesearchaeota archaeon]